MFVQYLIHNIFFVALSMKILILCKHLAKLHIFSDESENFPYCNFMIAANFAFFDIKEYFSLLIHISTKELSVRNNRRLFATFKGPLGTEAEITTSGNSIKAILFSLRYSISASND